MIVNDVENNAEPMPVRCVDEALQSIGAAI
jgi:hypothetical protein